MRNGTLRASAMALARPVTIEPMVSLGMAAALALLLAGAIGTFLYPLNGDVQYVLGGLNVSQAGPLETFVHRPFAYRLLLAPLAGMPEPIVRVAGIAAAGATGWLLGRSLTPSVGVATAAALILSPAWSMLQPEWWAALFVALAVAMRSRPPAAGAAIALAVSMKLATIAFVPLALLAISALGEWKRTALWSLGWCLAWFAVSAGIEWQWLMNMALLNDNSLLRAGDYRPILRIGALPLVAPVVVLVPLALVGIGRWSMLALAGALLLAASPILIQGQGSMYHLAAVPIVVAAVVTWKRPALLPVVVALSALTVLPAASWGTGERTNATWADASRRLEDEVSLLRGSIGPDEPVLYLTYGTVGYHLGNPTDCRYPSPLWLVVGEDLASGRDNARCLDDENAVWVIIEPAWYDGPLPTRADCADMVHTDHLVACPLRSDRQ